MSTHATEKQCIYEKILNCWYLYLSKEDIESYQVERVKAKKIYYAFS